MTVQNIQQNQSDDLPSHVIIIPPIEEDIILPKSAGEAMPQLSVAEEINMRAKTIKLVADLKGENIEPMRVRAQSSPRTRARKPPSPQFPPPPPPPLHPQTTCVRMRRTWTTRTRTTTTATRKRGECSALCIRFSSLASKRGSHEAVY